MIQHLFLTLCCFLGSSLASGKPSVLHGTSVTGETFSRRLQDILYTGFGDPLLTSPEHSAKDLPETVDNEDVKTVQDNFATSARLMEKAANVGESEEEGSILEELFHAMRLPAPTNQTGQQIQLDYSSMATDYQRDLSTCPGGWSLRGGSCHATDVYSGPCPRELNLESVSPDQALAIEQFCKVKFQSRKTSKCSSDFRGNCPSFWREVADHVCEAPSDYSGFCRPLVNTMSWTNEDKQNYAVACQASWPCQALASPKYTDACPAGWTLTATGLCQSPASYKGPCGSTMSTASASVTEKAQLEETCGVTWAPSSSRCWRDYTKRCPSDWRRTVSADGMTLCLAASAYAGHCSKIQAFDDWTPAEKAEWSQACSAEFPCMAE